MSAAHQKDLATSEALNVQPNLLLSREAKGAGKRIQNPYCHIAYLMKPPYKSQKSRVSRASQCMNIFTHGEGGTSTLQREAPRFRTLPDLALYTCHLAVHHILDCLIS